MRLPQRSTKAFTLIELIVVIVILGILALIAIPTFTKVIRKTQDEATRATLSSMLRDTRALMSFADGSTWDQSFTTAAGETAAPTSGMLVPTASTGAEPSTNPRNQAVYSIDGPRGVVAVSLRSASGNVCTGATGIDFTTSVTCAPALTSGSSSANVLSGAALGDGSTLALPAAPSTAPVKPAYSSVILGDGPTAYYSLEEASGTSAAARIGAAGTYSGTPTTTTGAIGSAVQFGTIGMQPGTNPFASNIKNFSVEAWVKGTDSTSYRYIAGTNDWTGTKGFTFYTGGSGGLQFAVTTTSGTASTSAIAPTTIWNGQWHHVVATYGTGIARLYMDGKEATTLGSVTSDFPLAASTNPLTVGKYSGTEATLAFNGAIDEVAFYTKTLTAAQVSTHYAAR